MLVPGILALSTRARYFSFHLFLLDEYARRKLTPDQASLGNFIRRREFEFAAAVLLCERCQSRPVGVDTVEPALRAATSGLLDRGESVKSPYGAYGLYYRSPLSDLGLVAPQGSLMGEKATPIDLLAGARAQGLAAAFRKQVAETEYYRQHFMGDDPIDLGVLREYAESCCLCRLDQSPTERQLLYGALLELQENLDEQHVSARRAAFALFLRLLGEDAEIATDQSAFRRATWAAMGELEEWESARAKAASQWAALHGKEYLQEALRLIWTDTNLLGRDSQPRDGFRPSEFMELIGDLLIPEGEWQFGSVKLTFSPSMPINELQQQVIAATARFDLELVLDAAQDCVSPGLGGLCLLLILHDRAQVAADAPAGSGWRQVGGINGYYQPGLLAFLQRLDDHLEDQTVGEVLQWIVRTRILRPHDEIATGKLPDFTFRFRLEGGRLRFYGEAGLWFPLANSRHDVISALSFDLGLWDRDGQTVANTARGLRLIDEVFGS